jgi:hypothetical protein
MSKKGKLDKKTIKGIEINYTICGYNKFYIRKTLLNTPGMTFMNLDWANKSAINHVCGHCGHILWFLP